MSQTPLIVYSTSNLDIEMARHLYLDEYRFCLQYHDDRILVWLHHREHMLLAYIRQRHTGTSPKVTTLCPDTVGSKIIRAFAIVLAVFL